MAAVGIDDPWRYVGDDPGIVRPADAPQTWGDPSRARQDLGWEPTTSLAELIQAMVAVDVERIANWGRGISVVPLAAYLRDLHT